MPKQLITEVDKSYFKRLVFPFLEKLKVPSAESLFADSNYCPVTYTYPNALKAMWNIYKGYTESTDSKLEQGMINAYLSFFAETKLDDLPSGSVGFFLGRRRTQVKYITTVFKSRGFVLEKTDPDKATFFIVGDILYEDENILNKDLTKPIVMDMTLDDEYNCSFADVSNLEVNDNRLFSLFSDPNLEKLHTLVNLLKFVNPRKLSNKMRIRLLMYYLSCVGTKGYSYSDLKHKYLIKEMKRISLPYHQFFLEPKFANLRYNLDYRCSMVNSGIYSLSSSPYSRDPFRSNSPRLGELGVKSSYEYSYGYFRAIVPLEDDCKDLFLDDISNNIPLSSLVRSLLPKKPGYSSGTYTLSKSDYYTSKAEFKCTFTSSGQTSSWTRSKYDTLKYNLQLFDCNLHITIEFMKTSTLCAIHSVDIRTPFVSERNSGISTEVLGGHNILNKNLNQELKNPLRPAISYKNYVTTKNFNKIKDFINKELLDAYSTRSTEYSSVTDPKLTLNFKDLLLETLIFPFLEVQKLDKEAEFLKGILSQIKIT